MATRSRLNWKVLDTLLPIFEKEGWSHAQIVEDWGISLATLEGHLDQQEGLMAPPRRYIDWQCFDELKAQGLPLLRISAEMGIPEATLRQSAQRRDKTHQSTPEAHHNTPKAHPRIPEEPELSEVHPGTPEPAHVSPDEQYTQTHPDTLPDADHTEVHHGTLEGHQEVMEEVHQSVPDAPHIGTEEPYQSTPEHPSTPEVHPELSPSHSSAVHSGVPARQDQLISSLMVHPGTPSEEDWELWNTIKAMWLRVGKMLSDQQVLLSTPMGTPRQTQKKTYVFDVQHIALIDEYARVHRMELKEVIHLMCEEFFQRR
jgi:hypothetical protein